MSNSNTPTFRVEMQVLGSHYTPAAWPTKHAGRPNEQTLREYVEGFEASTRSGGVNDHLGEEFVMSAKVIRQATNKVVATYVNGPLS